MVYSGAWREFERIFGSPSRTCCSDTVSTKFLKEKEVSYGQVGGAVPGCRNLAEGRNVTTANRPVSPACR